MQSIKHGLNNVVFGVRHAAAREEGQGTVEYVLVLGLLSIVFVAAAVSGLTQPVTDAIADIAAKLNSVV